MQAKEIRHFKDVVGSITSGHECGIMLEGATLPLPALRTHMQPLVALSCVVLCPCGTVRVGVSHPLDPMIFSLYFLVSLCHVATPCGHAIWPRHVALPWALFSCYAQGTTASSLAMALRSHALKPHRSLALALRLSSLWPSLLGLGWSGTSNHTQDRS